MHIERSLCRVCLTRLAAEGFRTCDECGAQVRDALDDIMRLYATVVTGQPRRYGPTVSSEVLLLVKMWDWIRRQDAVDEFARDLFALRSTLQRLDGQTRGRIRLGQCPARISVDGSAERVRCGQSLHARPGERLVRCGRCGTPYPALAWVALARQMEAE